MTKPVRIKWIESRQFVGVDSTDHSVVISSTSDGIGMKPSDLLLVALGGCIAYDVVGILEKKRQNLTGLEIVVSGEQDEDPPWTFRKVHMHFAVRGRGLKEKAVRDAIALAEEKYCSVAATVRGVAEIVYEHAIIEDS
jgi:putative redox protein